MSDFEDVLNELRVKIHNFDELDEVVKELLIESVYNKGRLELYDKIKNDMDNKGKVVRNIRHKPEIMYIFKDSASFNNIKIDGLNVFNFLPGTVQSFKQSVIEILSNVENNKNVIRTPISYMRLVIHSDNEIKASTRLVGVSLNSVDINFDVLENEFTQTINDIIKRIYGYSDLVRNEVVSYVKFIFISKYFPQPKSIDKWGNNIDNIINFKDFDLFTANNKDINCIQQCADFIWNDSSVIMDLESLMKKADNKICILYPKEYVNDIKTITGFSDLRLTSYSPIKSLSVIKTSYIFILTFNEHMGVIHNIKKSIYSKMFTEFTPLYNSASKKDLTVCYDIECYFNPNDRLLTHNIPYICCASFIYDNEIIKTESFRTRYCLEEMLKYIVYFCENLNIKSVELVAHNGGSYDFHYLLSVLPNPSIINNILMRNNSFISFNFSLEGVKFIVKDSYSFLLSSLSNAAKAFLIEDNIGKTSFPHFMVNTEEDLNKIVKSWDRIDSLINMEYMDNKLIIQAEDVINYNNDNESKKLIDWSEEYCKNDVFVLSNVWIQFKQSTEEIFNYNIVDDSFTLAGMSFKLFKANLDSNIILKHLNKEDYNNIRCSLVGGRCISLNGIYENILCLDVKSLYPAAMCFYDQPYGNYNRVNKRVINELGVYYVKVIPNINPKTNFFPIKQKDKVYYNDFGEEEFCSWYTTVDIDIGISEGHNIEYIPFDKNGNVGYSWKNKGKIFKKYIQDVLYKYKLMYEKENNKVKRNIIKIIMNSLWGKFAQKWTEKSYKIMNQCEIDFFNETVYDIWDNDYMLVEIQKDDKFSSKPLQNGVFTLSWARHHMKKIWDASIKEGAVCIYSDTDSICVQQDYFDLNAKFILDGEEVSVIGDDIGQLELEIKFSKLMCAGKKQYMGFYLNPETLEVKEKKRFKGIPQKYIIPSVFEFLLDRNDRLVQFNFLKFKKSWGVVNGYIEKKNVKST